MSIPIPRCIGFVRFSRLIYLVFKDLSRLILANQGGLSISNFAILKFASRFKDKTI
jgi:hypothetical protein